MIWRTPKPPTDRGLGELDAIGLQVGHGLTQGSYPASAGSPQASKPLGSPLGPCAIAFKSPQGLGVCSPAVGKGLAEAVRAHGTLHRPEGTESSQLGIGSIKQSPFFTADTTTDSIKLSLKPS